MPLVYQATSESGPLRQGEILADVLEHRVKYPAAIPEEGDDVDFDSVEHPLLVVMTADCDLEWDYEARDEIESGQDYDQETDETHGSKILPHVLMCRAFYQSEIRDTRGINSTLWRMIRTNQSERYHKLSAAPIKDSTDQELPDLFMDFKKIITFPTNQIYAGLTARRITRVAILPPVYVHDLMHRFYGFLSRVGLPD